MIADTNPVLVKLSHIGIVPAPVVEQMTQPEEAPEVYFFSTSGGRWKFQHNEVISVAFDSYSSMMAEYERWLESR